MCIVTANMRSEFINGLRPTYARHLCTKFIHARSDIEFAAVNLYLSGTPFQNRGPLRQPRETIPANVQIGVAPIVDKVHAYFTLNPPSANEAAFDALHEELCDLFIAGFPPYHHTYGNAQKFINVLFKYLACFADSHTFSDWFKYCHMAIDRYVYNGYQLPFYRDVVYSSVHGGPAPTLTPWSTLDKSDYLAIIHDIRHYISTHPKTYNDYLDICSQLPILTTVPKIALDYVLTPFEAEFFLWPIAQECNNRTVYTRLFVIEIRGLL